MATHLTRLDDQQPDRERPAVPPMRTVRRPHREPNYDLDVVPTAQLTPFPPAPAHPTPPVVRIPAIPSQPLPGDYTNRRGYSVMNVEEWQAFRDLQRWMAAYEQILRAEPMPFRSHEHPMAGMTNELRMVSVVGVRKLARKMQDLVTKKAQVYDIHLQYDERPEGGA